MKLITSKPSGESITIIDESNIQIGEKQYGLTQGAINAFKRGIEGASLVVKKICTQCGFVMPAFSGRYPNSCPVCGKEFEGKDVAPESGVADASGRTGTTGESYAVYHNGECIGVVTENKVKIEHWIQDTMESGHWELTQALTREDAEKILNKRILHRGRLVDINGNALKESRNEFSKMSDDALVANFIELMSQPKQNVPEDVSFALAQRDYDKIMASFRRLSRNYPTKTIDVAIDRFQNIWNEENLDDVIFRNPTNKRLTGLGENTKTGFESDETIDIVRDLVSMVRANKKTPIMQDMWNELTVNRTNNDVIGAFFKIPGPEVAKMTRDYMGKQMSEGFSDDDIDIETTVRYVVNLVKKGEIKDNGALVRLIGLFRHGHGLPDGVDVNVIRNNMSIVASRINQAMRDAHVQL